MQLLKDLLQIQSPSGNETPMRDFLINYFKQNQSLFKVQPQLFFGDEFQDGLAVSFGKPKVAIFAHMDTVAYMARYNNALIEIGSPAGESGDVLIGEEFGTGLEAEVILQKEEDENGENKWFYNVDSKVLLRGTELVYKPNVVDDEEYIQSPYLDNRIGIYNALKVAETLENGMLVFTCWEEHQGGAAAQMSRFVHDEFDIRKVLISDVTWVSEGIKQGLGTVISLRDEAIPRRKYVLQIIEIANKSNLPYQVEVEDLGGSDGHEIQKVPYSIDWCFVGMPCENMHSSKERILKADLENTIKLYVALMKELN